MVCFDTSYLVDLVRRNPEAEKKLAYFLERDETLTTTPISAAELFEGAYSPRRKSGELERITGLLEHLELLDLSLEVCEKYGRIVNELRTRGSPISDLDVFIASAAIVHRQILLTRDKAHFDRVPGLAVDSW